MAKEKKVEPIIKQVATPNIQPLMYSHSDGRVYLYDKKLGKRTLMHLKSAQSMVRSNNTRYEIQP